MIRTTLTAVFLTSLMAMLLADFDPKLLDTGCEGIPDTEEWLDCINEDVVIPPKDNSIDLDMGADDDSG